jgi:hypothetical protein
VLEQETGDRRRPVLKYKPGIDKLRDPVLQLRLAPLRGCSH